VTLATEQAVDAHLQSVCIVA
jgi:hypothetical protein